MGLLLNKVLPKNVRVEGYKIVGSIPLAMMGQKALGIHQ